MNGDVPLANEMFGNDYSRAEIREYLNQRDNARADALLDADDSPSYEMEDCNEND